MSFVNKIFGKVHENLVPKPTPKKLSPKEREAEIKRLLSDPQLRKEHGLD
jgi:hypothetical protein